MEKTKMTVQVARKLKLVKFWPWEPCGICNVWDWRYTMSNRCQNCSRIASNASYHRKVGHDRMPHKHVRQKRATIPGARFIPGRCQSGSPDAIEMLRTTSNSEGGEAS